MPLVVPALRFFVVFLNVYETFKTLKPPPPSARQGGQPSVRAISQRKRDLKGCLAIWIVWCCYAVYERTFDRVVGIFLPFYSEIKSVFLLFVLLTRAKGAEPLFLHILRPFIKPYAVVVDPTLELSRDLGDFIFALSQVPLDYILSSPWISFWRVGELEQESIKIRSSTMVSSVMLTQTNGHSEIPAPADHVTALQASRAHNRPRGSVRSISDNHGSGDRLFVSNGPHPTTFRDRISKSASTTSLPAYSEHPSPDPPRYSQTQSRRNGHQVWCPPASAYLASSQEALADLPGIAPEYHSPEWRTYPAFPSAYPPTPLPASVSLPSLATRKSDDDHQVTVYPPIPEDERGFDELLGRQHEGYPSSMHSSSNNVKSFPGANNYELDDDTTRQQDEDTLLDDSMCSSETGLSEDDFGTSLRTPLRPAAAIPSDAYSSVDSLTSALTSTDNARSLRTKASFGSESSGSSSLAGRKRSHRAFQGKTQNMLPTPESRNATLRGKFIKPQDPLQSSPSEGEDESELGDDDGSTKAKKQRVLDPSKRKSTVRPTTRGLGSARKGLSSRGVATHNRANATTSQTTLRNREGSTTTNSLTIKARKTTLVTRQAMRYGPQGVVKSSSTSSSQSGTLRGRAY